MTDQNRKVPVTVHLSTGLIRAIDSVLDGRSRSFWIERALWLAVPSLNKPPQHELPPGQVWLHDYGRPREFTDAEFEEVNRQIIALRNRLRNKPEEPTS